MPTSRTLDDLPVLNSLSSSDIIHVRHLGTDSKLTKSALFTSPTLTGTPTAPTASNGTNTTQIATTAFVLANASGGGSVAWGSITGTLADQTDLGNAAHLNVNTDVSLTASSDTEIPTQNAVKTYVDNSITGISTSITGKENSLGNPDSDGYVLSSTTIGTRSWVAAGGGVSDTIVSAGDASASIVMRDSGGVSEYTSNTGTAADRAGHRFLTGTTPTTRMAIADDAVVLDVPMKLQFCSVTNMPAAYTHAGCLIVISDRAATLQLGFSDGIHWYIFNSYNSDNLAILDYA